MTRQYFGTDGIRGTVGQPPITPDFVLRLAHAVGRVLRRTEERPTVLIGKDTRISGYMLESALESGFNSAGVDVVLLGPLPTPGVAYLTRAQRASLGVVISASHNAYPDNGIKFFSAQGTKLPDEWEQQVEAARAATRDEVVEVLVGAEPRIDAVEVERVVAVGLRREDRPEQQPGGAELDGVVEPVEQPPQPRRRGVLAPDRRPAEPERVDVPPDRVVNPVHRLLLV